MPRCTAYCGNKLPPALFVSNTAVTVHFVSDAFNQVGGFDATYRIISTCCAVLLPLVHAWLMTMDDIPTIEFGEPVRSARCPIKDGFTIRFTCRTTSTQRHSWSISWQTHQ